MIYRIVGFPYINPRHTKVTFTSPPGIPFGQLIGCRSIIIIIIIIITIIIIIIIIIIDVIIYIIFYIFV